MKNIYKTKSNGFVRDGMFSHEIVYGNYSYIYTTLSVEETKEFKRGMFLFGMVRKDAKVYLKNNKIKLPKKLPSIDYNKKIREDAFGVITSTDLNDAYWRIANNLGIITEATFIKGLKNEFKAVRLAALSTMGREKKYTVIKKGDKTDKMHVIKGDIEMANVYTLIRYTCFKYMNQVKKMLGKDFLAYKTDAIYYCDTEENKKMVNDYFEQKNLVSKQAISEK